MSDEPLGGDPADLVIPTLARRFWSEGVLFPDADAKSAIVVTGEVRGDRSPFLLRVGEDGRERWSARPATEIHRIVLFEPPGRPRLLVATTWGGELLVLDEEGTLRARAKLPGSPGSDGRVSTRALAAGPFGADGLAIAVGLRNGTHVYRLRPERLPAR